MPDGIKDALLIYNLSSGRRRHRRFAEVEEAARILDGAGIDTELAPTKGRGSATGIARLAVKQRRGMVIVCGGDGTTNEVVNGLAGSHVPLALLPAGTANILAKELRIPWDIPHGARLIPDGVIRRIALGMVIPPDGRHAADIPREGRYFICTGGAGADGAIVNALDLKLKENAGILAYWAEGMRQLMRYPFSEFRVRSEGEERRATTIIIGRAAHYGGPFQITTGASLFEDSFEIVAVSIQSRARYLQCLPALWLGKLRTLEGIHAWKATKVCCEPIDGQEVYAQVDGEPIGLLPREFRIVPDALSIVTPAGRKA